MGLSLPAALPPQALQPDESAHVKQLHAQMTAGERGLNGKPQDVKSAAAELSSLFVYQMLAAMRRTVPNQQAGPTDGMFMLPVEGQHTSGFGMRMHPIDHTERLHSGMDIAAPTGTPIQAAAAGQVVFSGTQAGYGNVVVIQHEGGYSTLYAHNTANLVSVGTPVSQGQPIATVGSTGRSTGPHLHCEVRKDGKQLDPAQFFAAGSTPKPAPAVEADGSSKIALKFLMASTDTKVIQ